MTPRLEVRVRNTLFVMHRVVPAPVPVRYRYRNRYRSVVSVGNPDVSHVVLVCVRPRNPERWGVLVCLNFRSSGLRSEVATCR